MSTRLDTALTGPALRLHLIEVLAPTCGMETPKIANACWDFIHQDAAVKIDAAMFRGDKTTSKQPMIPEGGIPALLPDPPPQPKPTLPSIDMDAVERLYAAGLPQTTIAERLGIGTEKLKKALATAIDIKERWPRNAAGIPQHTLYPEDAPWPPAADWANDVEPGPDRRGRFTQYAQEGLSEEDIANAENIKTHSVSASMSTYRLTGIWRENQAKRLGVAPAPHRDKKSDREILEPLCRAGASREQIAKALGVASNGIHMRVAKAGLSAIWEDALAAKNASPEEPPAPVEAEAPISNAKVTQALAKLAEPLPARLPNLKNPETFPVAPSSARAELAAHGVDGADLPQGVPVTKAGPKVWEHPGGRATIADVIAWLRHSGDTVIEAGKGMWLMNGEQAAARDLAERANRQRKRLRDPRFDLFELVKG